MTDLTRADLTARALRLAGSQRKLAKRLGMSKGRLSQIVLGARLNVENCIRLADLLDEDLVLVLRAYDYPQLADILQGLYTKQRRVTHRRARIYETLNGLQWRDRVYVEGLIARLAVPGTSSDIGTHVEDLRPPVKGGLR